jgi:hypothetical protein
MEEQRQHVRATDSLRAGTAGDGSAASAARLARVRAQLTGVYAAADAILETIRQDDNERFLAQVRQSGGQ